MAEPKTKESKPFKGIQPEPCKMCGNEMNIMVKYDQFRDKLKMNCTYCGYEWFEDTFEKRLANLPPNQPKKGE
jgi:hypothetical protein